MAKQLALSTNQLFYLGFALVIQCSFSYAQNKVPTQKVPAQSNGLTNVLPLDETSKETGQDSKLTSSVIDDADETRLRVLIQDGKISQGITDIDTTTISSSFSVIKADRIRHSFVSLPDVLEQEVGVQTRATGGEGSLTTVVLRGSSSEQVIIYLDGIPLNDASGGPVDLSFIPVDSIERIEVYRGSTPLELGSPSIGGAVNIITRRVVAGSSLNASQQNDENFSHHSQISASVASFQTYKLSGSSLLSFNKDDILVTASYLQSENNFSFLNDNGTQFNGADDRVEKRNNDGVKQLALLANWKHRINKKYDTEVRLDFINREKDIPGVTNNADVQTYLDTQQYNFLAQLNAHSFLLNNLDVNIRLFATQKTEIFDDSLAQIGFFNQHTESKTKKLGTQLFATIKQSSLQWKILSSLSQETYDTKSNQALADSGRNTRDRMEMSAENIAYFNNHRLIFNSVLRYQLIQDNVAQVSDNFGVVTAAFDKQYKFLDPQLGVKYLFNKRTYATANIGLYNRAPSFFELFGGGGLVLGNADLKPERSLNTDVGMTYTWFKPYTWLHDTELYAGVFYNKVEDLIVRIFNGQGIGLPENISDAVIQGLETTVKITPAKRHTVNISFSYIDSVNETDITSFKGKALPGYYQQNYGFRYAYAVNRWLYSMEADIKRNTFYDRSNLLKGDDVNLINLGIRRYFNASNIDFRLDNILDENIQYFRNRPTPGLSASLTYNHSF